MSSGLHLLVGDCKSSWFSFRKFPCAFRCQHESNSETPVAAVIGIAISSGAATSMFPIPKEISTAENFDFHLGVEVERINGDAVPDFGTLVLSPGIQNPFLNISVHVVQAEGIRSSRADRTRIGSRVKAVAGIVANPGDLHEVVE